MSRLIRLVSLCAAVAALFAVTAAPASAQTSDDTIAKHPCIENNNVDCWTTWTFDTLAWAVQKVPDPEAIVAEVRRIYEEEVKPPVNQVARDVCEFVDPDCDGGAPQLP